MGYVPSDVRKNYTGYEKDEESGLEYAQARYYNPQHGRFTSADPLTASASIRNPQTFNRYNYGLNSPYKFTDPLGLAASLACHSSNKGTETSQCTRDAVEQRAAGQHEQGQQPSPLPSNGPSVNVNYDWVVTNDNGRASVAPEIQAKLNTAASQMATNIFRAMIAVNAVTNNPEEKTSVTFEGGVSVDASIAGGKKGAAVKPSGGTGEFSASGSTEYASADPIVRDLQVNNDNIRSGLVSDLMDEGVPLPVKVGPPSTVKAGDTEAINAPNLASSFGIAVQRIANEEAAKAYNNSFPERGGVPAKFANKNF